MRWGSGLQWEIGRCGENWSTSNGTPLVQPAKRTLKCAIDVYPELDVEPEPLIGVVLGDEGVVEA